MIYSKKGVSIILKHGESKTLTVIKQPPEGLLGSALLTVDSVWDAWWDETNMYDDKPNGRWKISYGNGIVGWWEDKYFDYDSKEMK